MSRALALRNKYTGPLQRPTEPSVEETAEVYGLVFDLERENADLRAGVREWEDMARERGDRNADLEVMLGTLLADWRKWAVLGEEHVQQAMALLNDKQPPSDFSTAGADSPCGQTFVSGDPLNGHQPNKAGKTAPRTCRVERPHGPRVETRRCSLRRGAKE